MKEILDFFQAAGAYFLATEEAGQPHLRPFGTFCLFEDKIYFQTGKVKDVFRQLMANPKVELCAMNKNGDRWLRISATAVRDDRLEARAAVLDQYPSLKKMYAADDGNCEVFFLQDAKATFYSFTEAPRTVTF